MNTLHTSYRPVGRLTTLMAIAIIGVSFSTERPANANVCDTLDYDFTEDFETTAFKDEEASSVAHWEDQETTWDNGYAALRYKGVNIDVSNPWDFPAWISLVTTGDFDCDGWPDFVGSAYGDDRVDFIRNMGWMGDEFIGSWQVTGDPEGGDCMNQAVEPVPAWCETVRRCEWTRRRWWWWDRNCWDEEVCHDAIPGDPGDNCMNNRSDSTPERGYMTNGDYDHDGDLDVLYIDQERAWLFENLCSSCDEACGGNPLSWNRHNLDNTIATTKIRRQDILWGSGATSGDMDGDGWVDVLAANDYGDLYFLQNSQSGNVATAFQNGDARQVADLRYDRNWFTGSWSYHKGPAIGVVDYDRDGDLDLFTGHIYGPGLFLWRHDGNLGFENIQLISDTGGFDYYDDEIDGAITAITPVDVDFNGYPDLAIATDEWAWGTHNGGQLFIVENHGVNPDGTFNYTTNLVFNRAMQRDPDGSWSGSQDVYDFDFAGSLDYDRDGLMDVLVADGNHSENYYLFEVDAADVFNLVGWAVSTEIDDLDAGEYAIVAVQVEQANYNVPADTTLTFEITNDGGETWDTLTAEELAGTVQHDFNTFGAALMWRARLEALEDASVDPDKQPASKVTPRIDELRLKYYAVKLRQYSRSSQALAYVDRNGDGINEEILLSSAFWYPGWWGHMRAMDVSNVTDGGAADPSLTRVQGIGEVDLWDAGYELYERDWWTRDLFTAHDPSGGDDISTPLDFNEANADVLQPLMRTGVAQTTEVIRFVLGERSFADWTYQGWKLWGINHSSPQVVAEPTGNPGVLGAAYGAYKTANANRDPVAYVGSDGGALHAFRVRDGRELWAFVPHNQLARLAGMVEHDEWGRTVYKHRSFVDGVPRVADALVGGNWRTVLITGQGPGVGKDDRNYWFALDVTDPYDPKPLWELTDEDLPSDPNDSIAGETWSIPAIGQVKVDGRSTTMAFFASGYDNLSRTHVGKRVYGIDAATGDVLFALDTDDDPTTPIENTLPASPTLVDTNADGYVDRAYIGDLEGRVWKIDTSSSGRLSGGQINNWPVCVKVDAGNPSGGGARTIAPIVGAIAARMYRGTPYIYFGTGGDEAAPSDQVYHVYGLADPDRDGYCTQRAISSIWDEWDEFVYPLPEGQKVWATPVIAYEALFVASLAGDIKSANPCSNLTGEGLLHSIAVRTGIFLDTTSTPRWVKAGEPILYNASGDPFYSLPTAHKVRAAVAAGSMNVVGAGEDEHLEGRVFIQNFTNPDEGHEEPVVEMLTIRKPAVRHRLHIRSWREVY